MNDEEVAWDSGFMFLSLIFDFNGNVLGNYIATFLSGKLWYSGSTKKENGEILCNFSETRKPLTP